MFRTTLRSLWSHKRRLISTCMAVLLGVAFMAGTLVLNSTIGQVFDDLFGSIGQGVDAQVRGPELFKSEVTGEVRRELIDDDVIAKVMAVDGVAAADGSIQSGALTVIDKKGSAIGGTGPPTLVGSWSQDKKLSSFQVASGRAPEKPGEAIIDRGTAKKTDFAIGDALVIISGKERVTLTIVGISRFGEADSAGGATFVGTTLPQAQELIGEPGKVNMIDARADDGVSPDELVSRLKKADLLDKADIITGKEASEEAASSMKESFGFLTTALLIFAAVALFVGWFIISNTFSILVAQRTKELALLRAIGASRRQVLGSVLLEAGLVGLVSGVLGLLAGIGLATAAFELLKSFGLDLPGASIIIEPNVAVKAVLVGLGITAIAAIAPAVKATRVAPIAALRDVAVDSSGQSKARAGIGLVMLAAGIYAIIPAFAVEVMNDDLPQVGVGLALLVLSVLVLGPITAKPFALAVGSWIPLVKGITGKLARQNAVRSPRRTAATAAALIIGVALVSFITIFASSAKASINKVINLGFEGDYIVQSANQFNPVGGVPPSVANDLAKVDGVKGVTAVTLTNGQLTLPDGSEKVTFIGGIDPTTSAGIFDFDMASGKLTDLKPGGMLVDRATARDNDVKVGEKISILSDSGRSASFTVAAISDSPAILGEWTIHRDDAPLLTAEPTDFLIGISLDPGVSVDSVRGELLTVMKPYPQMKVQDRQQYTSSLVNSVTAILNVIYGLLAVSIVIALIGIANTLSLSINERTRELGLLRAMGMTRSQLRSSVRWEAVIVALMGSVIGIAMGIFLSWVLVLALAPKGITEFAVPVTWMALIAVIAAGLAVVASIGPAGKASRLNVLEAIATE
ncbi:MAG: FtsX-like permease family protein [Aquihabitans sp.]